MYRYTGCWLDAIPASSLGLKLTNSQFRISATRLGCKVTEPHSCSRCGKEVLPDGLHGLSCIRSAGRLPRHTMLNDIVRRALASCGVPSILEPPGHACRGDGKHSCTLDPWPDTDLGRNRRRPVGAQPHCPDCRNRRPRC